MDPKHVSVDSVVRSLCVCDHFEAVLCVSLVTSESACVCGGVVNG